MPFPRQPRGCGRATLPRFVNLLHKRRTPWERLIQFLESASIVSAGRGAQLLSLPQSDPQAAEALLLKARRLGSACARCSRHAPKARIAGEWIEPLNEILRITEGHDELVAQAGVWKIEFVAREGGLDWLLAAWPAPGGDYRRGRPARAFGFAPIRTVACSLR